MQQKQLLYFLTTIFFFFLNWVKHKLSEPFYCLEFLLQI